MADTLRIRLPQPQNGYERGANGTYAGQVMKFRLSKNGLENLREAAERLDMPMSQFMRQVVEDAAKEVCDDEGPSPPVEGS